MRGKPLKFKLLENGCVIPTTHKLNSEFAGTELVVILITYKCLKALNTQLRVTE